MGLEPEEVTCRKDVLAYSKREFSSVVSYGRRRQGVGDTEFSGYLEQPRDPHTVAAEGSPS